MSQHIVPTEDSIGHELNTSCPCEPARDYKRREDGTTGWVVTHHALDGRGTDQKITEE